MPSVSSLWAKFTGQGSSKFRCVPFNLAQVKLAVLDHATLVCLFERLVLQRLVGLVPIPDQ